MNLNKIQDIIKEEITTGVRTTTVTFEIYGRNINFFTQSIQDDKFGFCFFAETKDDEEKIETILDEMSDESGDARISRSYKIDKIWRVINDELNRRSGLEFIPFWDYKPDVKHSDYYFSYLVNWMSILSKIIK